MSVGCKQGVVCKRPNSEIVWFTCDQVWKDIA